LARILALSFQVDSFNPTESDYEKYSSFDIREINAANENSVDFVRSLSEKMSYRPMNCKAKVVILDESHQLSNAAQNALLKDTEDTSDFAFYIFCTSNIKKIIPALQRRACILTPTLLSDEYISNLVKNTCDSIDYNGSIDNVSEFINVLTENDVRSPGLVLQACERFFSGHSPQESVTFSEMTSIDTRLLCNNVSKGDWKKCAELLVKVSNTDVFSIKLQIIGYLKSILLKASGTRAVKLSKCIREIESIGDTVGSLIAGICIVCDLLAAKKVVASSSK
jgi:DNA polymerase III delta prime subunit